MYPPPPGPHLRPQRARTTVPLFAAILIAVGSMLFGCVTGLAIGVTPTAEETGAAAASSSPSPSEEPSSTPETTPTATPTARAATPTPTPSDVPDPDPTTTKPKPRKTTREPEPEPEPEPRTDPRFSSCTKAKASGYGPYTRGVHREYFWYQDRDGDGVVCES
ncbi:excalibur calcium-binding domain-containing protein [Actinomadura algeriensis]|uniref:Outer membrane biosynthesis protein TonB n=1 Tax=Actinomadura algeriensis TaxID=1679523 RepID=A0ABR9JSQ2_9ACTN|nr:excalibur calcium-binding domain-containing protein [Actinomadura algeriensis]MBE1533582.1 outer membrane biosynthesis protein TonB [Actinomadura algeriensis]